MDFKLVKVQEKDKEIIYNLMQLYIHDLSLYEDFVINKYRRTGAGTFMANSIFEKYKGKWEVRTLRKNERAQSFWRKVINEDTNGKFTEQFINNNSRYAFYFEN